jgi:hypothetical protein
MKVKKIITIIFTVLAIGMVCFSGIMKFVGGPEMADGMTKMGVAQYVIVLAVMEITFAILFAFPQTMKIGFILLSCYFAGALATELSHASPLNALTPMILIWVSAFLRDKSIFLPSTRRDVEAA